MGIDDLEDIRIVTGNAPDSMYYSRQMLVDSIKKIDKEVPKLHLPDNVGNFLSYMGAYLVTLEPRIRDTNFSQSFYCRPADREFLTDIFELKNLDQLTKILGKEGEIAPDRLREFFPEIETLENCHLKGASLIGEHYACALAAAQKYRPLLIMAASEIVQEEPEKYQPYMGAILNHHMIIAKDNVRTNEIIIPTAQIICTIQNYGLSLEILPEVNQEIKRIKGLYESVNQIREEANKAKQKKDLEEIEKIAEEAIIKIKKHIGAANTKTLEGIVLDNINSFGGSFIGKKDVDKNYKKDDRYVIDLNDPIFDAYRPVTPILPITSLKKKP